MVYYLITRQYSCSFWEKVRHPIKVRLLLDVSDRRTMEEEYRRLLAGMEDIDDPATTLSRDVTYPLW